jgi:hypothetical protein
MAGAAQQPQGQPVATDPTKAQDGQIFKGGDVKGEGYDDFDKAREGMNQKLRQKQEADAAAEQAKIAEGQTKAKIEGKAAAIVEGIDINAIADEVDADFKMAEKIRAFRKLSPENEQKLAAISKSVQQRRQERIDKLLNDPDMNSDLDNALDAAGAQPPTQPQKPAGQQEPAGQQAPAEGTPQAQPGQQPPVQQPDQQLDINQLLDSKLAGVRKELEDKIKKTNNELEQERIRRQEAENKMKEMKQAEENRVQQEVRTNFNSNAGKLGIPEDLLDVAFGKARDIVNANQRQMSWDDIFAAMKTQFPSLFRGKQATAPAEGGGNAGADAGEAAKKVTVKAGTGTGAGGAGPKNPPPAAGGKKEHDSFDEAKKALSKRAEQMAAGGGG